MNTKFNIFLKPGTTVSINGKEFDDRMCIITEQSIDVIRDAIGDSVQQVISEKDFHPQTHSHRFDRYTYLPKLTSACEVNVYDGDLSPSEQRVHDLIVVGMGQQQIADKLFLSIQTIKFHTKAISRKKGVNSTREIIALHYMGREKFMEVRKAA
ncbi:helix-turn-helix transcriptional regulator [Alteromonas mediterranea]|uniref:helix-turn-helix transcriptional regulator n=1 Tax=Alteromonas mediterranea TaxID=314275 RepID=UPI00241C760A|nr:helix-turn-helix transcriptional regulator [Alteromonas mediterranea]